MSESDTKQQQPRRNRTKKGGQEPQRQQSGSGGGASINNANNSNDQKKSARSSKVKALYPPYESYDTCQKDYATYDTTLVRGKLRVLPTSQDSGSSFVTDDRGTFRKDILIADHVARNRALDGDMVFVRLDEKPVVSTANNNKTTGTGAGGLDEDEAGDEIVLDFYENSNQTSTERWQDDETQMALWNPVVPIERKGPNGSKPNTQKDEPQRQGKVVYVFPPVPLLSEIDPTPIKGEERTRPLVGYIKFLPSGVGLLNPLNKSLPQFKVPPSFKPPSPEDNDASASLDKMLFKGEYLYGSWEDTHKWPPCRNVAKMGECCVLEDEIQALLMQNQVDHGEFPSEVLKQVEDAVQSGLCHHNGNMEWKPTPDMYKGRRDYREERIFTIDPTTAKDLDDALHIKELPNGRIEVGYVKRICTALLF